VTMLLYLVAVLGFALGAICVALLAAPRGD
jgi:uncharacterized membrane protein YoaK (UPF0700 family)